MKGRFPRPGRSSTPPITGFPQCEKLAIAGAGRIFANAPHTASNIRIWLTARPLLGAGNSGLKNDPGRARTSIGRFTPSFWGRWGSVNTLTAKPE